VTTFIVVLVLILILGGVVGGWVLHRYWHEERERELGAREAVLDERWRALEQSQRIHLAFWRARSLMRDEAIKAQRDKFGDIT
jgi:hypothetical protein